MNRYARPQIDEVLGEAEPGGPDPHAPVDVALRGKAGRGSVGVMRMV